MAKQDGRRSCEAQSEPILPIPPRTEAHHQELQELEVPLGSAGPKGKIEARAGES